VLVLVPVLVLVLVLVLGLGVRGRQRETAPQSSVFLAEGGAHPWLGTPRHTRGTHSRHSYPRHGGGGSPVWAPPCMRV